MFCPECGEELSGESKFCGHCGAKLVWSDPGWSEKNHDFREEIKAEPMKSAAYKANAGKSGSKSPGKKKHSGIIVGIVAAMFVCVVAAALLLSGGSGYSDELISADEQADSTGQTSSDDSQEGSVSASEAGEILDSGTCGDNVTWTYYDNGLLKISGEGAMDIGSFNGTLPWGSDYHESIVTILIEDGVTSIADYAFVGSGVSSVEIADSVTGIGDYAFASCVNLTAITLPNGLTTVGQYAFMGCTALASAELSSQLTAISMGMFSNCSSLSEIDIPESVTSIGQSAFYHCDSLTEVVIPDSVTGISGQAFGNCEGLTKIYIRKLPI